MKQENSRNTVVAEVMQLYIDVEDDRSQDIWKGKEARE